MDPKLPSLTVLCFHCPTLWVLHHPLPQCRVSNTGGVRFLFCLQPEYSVHAEFMLCSPVGHSLMEAPRLHSSDWWLHAVLPLCSLGVCTLFIPTLAKTDMIMISHGNWKVYLNNLIIKCFHRLKKKTYSVSWTWWCAPVISSYERGWDA
jgi:hypothetical protein